MTVKLGFILGWRAFLTAFQPGPNRVLLSSSLSMALGLVPLIAILSLADGMIAGLISRTVETTTYHFQLIPATTSKKHFTEELHHDLKSRLNHLSGFESIWPERDSFGLAYSSPSQRTGVKLRGVDPAWLNHDQKARSFIKVLEGNNIFPEEGSVWVGKEIATKLGLHVGDQLKILTTRSSFERVLIPRITTFQVSAIVTIGYQDLDKLWVFLPIKTADQLFDLDESPLYWGIKSTTPFKEMEKQKDQLIQTFSYDFHVKNWKELMHSQFLNYQATHTLLFVVMALIFLVSTINITTAMTMTMLEKQEDMAILQSVGVSSSTIHWKFLFLGFFTGTLGTIVALIVGTLLVLGMNPIIHIIDTLVNFGFFVMALVAKVQLTEFHLVNTDYYLDQIPLQLDPPFLLTIGSFSIILATLASILPARRAATLRPLDTLRKV